jgi:hypothetical protein
MDMLEKAHLTNELAVLKGMISAASASGGFLSQMNFPVTGSIVTIPSLPLLAVAMNTQSECMEKLATLLERVIEAS